MAKRLVSQQAVIKVAEELVLADCNPTVAAIRARLKNGSETTIYKYLNQWKKKCFRKMITNSSSFDTDIIRVNLEEKRDLEQTLNKHIAQNEYYAQELIEAEKTNINLKDDCYQLQAKCQQLQSELNELKNINNALEQVTTEIKNKLENNDNKTIENLRQTIEGLKAELKKLNETSLEALREASAKGHDTLMQEKVNSINLQTKVDSLYKESIDLKKQLSDTVLKHQIQTQTLLRQVNEQQKIIQDHIGFDKLRELVGEEVMLHFNNKPGVAYGK